MRCAPRKSINQINVVPYIDVMLVLLVIFMVTAPLVAPGRNRAAVGRQQAHRSVDPLKVRARRESRLR